MAREKASKYELFKDAGGMNFVHAIITQNRSFKMYTDMYMEEKDLFECFEIKDVTFVNLGVDIVKKIDTNKF